MRRIWYDWSAAAWVVTVCLVLCGCPVRPDNGSEPVESASTSERVKAATRRYVLSLAVAAESVAEMKTTGDQEAAFKSASESARKVFSESVERALEARAPAAGGVKPQAWRDVGSGFRGAVR